MWKELFACLASCFIKVKTHCRCGSCCESDCMVEEGALKRADSKTSLKTNAGKTE